MNIKKLLCYIFGHKKLYNAFGDEPWDDGRCRVWFCQRCDFDCIAEDDS